MKKLFLLLLVFCLACTAAMAADPLTTEFAAPNAASLGVTNEICLTDAQARAWLTAALWLDYIAVEGSEPCPREALSGDTMVALHNESGFLLVVIPVNDGRLVFYYVAATGAAQYMWETGAYSADIKQEALENHGMTVWRNDIPLVEDALLQLVGE